jgi:hypothetical protein
MPLKQFVIHNIKDFTTSGQVPNMWFQPDPDGPLSVSGFPVAAPPVPAGPLIDVSALAAGTQLILTMAATTGRCQE